MWRALSLGFLLALMGCGEERAGAGVGAELRGVVVGVSFDAPLEGELDRLEVRVRPPVGEPLLEEIVEVVGREPIEVTLPEEAEGQRVSVSVDAYRGDTRLISRLAVLTVPPQQSLLLPMRLNDECRLDAAERDVTCSGLTCSAGFCVASTVNPSELPAYDPDWAAPGDGACGPVDQGEPEVAIGLAGAGFEPMEEGTVLTSVQGLQGGAHIYFNLRLRGVDEETAIVHRMLRVLSTGVDTVVTSAYLDVEVEPDGCHAHEHRYILPTGDFDGERLWLGVTASDATGNAAHHHVEVEIEPGGVDPPF